MANDVLRGGVLTAAAVDRYAAEVADAAILDELKKYVDFGHCEATVLRRLGPVLEPRFPEIVNSFYEAIVANSTTAGVFDSPAQIARQKRSLLEWMRGVFGGVYDEAYFRLRARIGRTHVRVGLEQRFMMSAMNLVRQGFHHALTHAEASLADDPDRADLLEVGHRAIDCICDIELAIMLETYREDYVLRKTAETETMAAMGRLTAGLAHEVRNPLNAAKLQLELLKRSTKRVPSEELRAQLDQRREIVSSELRRLSDLLDDFLSLAKPHQVIPTFFVLAPLLFEVRDLQEPLFLATGCELEIEVPSDVEVHADRARTKQVLVNLLQNAVEALQSSDPAELALKVAVDDPGMVAISIIDNGPGLAPEVAGKALDAFVTTKEAGTGLGLTIVKSIVEMHGGELTVGPRSDGARGTEARFTLPRR